MGMIVHKVQYMGSARVFLFHRFLLKNNIFTTVSTASGGFSSQTISLAFEKILSHGTEDAGMQR